MARIILTLDLNDIGMLLQGAELPVTPCERIYEMMKGENECFGGVYR